MRYEYKCDECDFEFECDHSILKEPGADCPQCGMLTSHRLISSGTFLLKGTGWAKDLYEKTSMNDEETIPTYTIREYKLKTILDCGSSCPRRTKIRYWTRDDVKSRQGKKWHPDFDCNDCGVNTARIGEYYMVQDDIWYSFDLTLEQLHRYRLPNGERINIINKNECMLCIGCLERRLGRTLTHRDFTDYPVNNGGVEDEPLHQFKKSLRLQLRLTSIHSHHITRGRSKDVI